MPHPTSDPNTPRKPRQDDMAKPTPHRRSTGRVSQTGGRISRSASTREELDPLLNDELEGHIIGGFDTDTFIDTLLTGTSAIPETAAYIDYNGCDSHLRQSLDHLDSNFATVKNGIYDEQERRWINLDSYNERRFLPALINLVDEIILRTKPTEPATSKRELFTSAQNPLEGRCRKRKLDIGLREIEPSKLDRPGNDTKWSEVLVVMEHTTKSQKFLKSKQLCLASYARNVFSSRPSQRYIFGLLFMKQQVSLYLFDHAGVLCTESFDFQKEPKKFATVITSLAWMSEQHLGRDPDIKRINGQDILKLRTTGEYLILEKTLCQRGHLVGRATACWQARPCDQNGVALSDDDKHLKVVKDAWRSNEKINAEQFLYECAIKKDIRGLPITHYMNDVVIDGCIDDTGKFIRGQILDKLGEKVQKSSWCDNGDSESDDNESDDNEESASIRRPDFTPGRKRSPITANFDEIDSRPRKKNFKRYSMVLPSKPSASQFGVRGCKIPTQLPPTAVSTRTHTRMVSNTIGSPIEEEAKDPQSLINIIRDAMLVHHRLHTEAKIIHHDISVSNILASNPNTRLTGSDEQLHGFLIDLDYAVLGNDRSGLLERTGTPEFMAIHTLQKNGSKHTYRRDLESFLYVILWLSVDNPEETLKTWYTGTLNAAANSKYSAMTHPVEFTSLLNTMKPEFRDKKFRGLCSNLRKILFKDFLPTDEEGEEILSNKNGPYFERLEKGQLEIYESMNQKMVEFLEGFVKPQGTESG